MADNLEVIVILKNNLGIRYYNKNEFSQKLIVPKKTVKQILIIEVKNDIKTEFSLSELNRNKVRTFYLFIVPPISGHFSQTQTVNEKKMAGVVSQVSL